MKAEETMTSFQLGVAATDITPPIGSTLMGYDPRISTFVEHPLRAEALACEGPNGGWILLSADVCAFASRLTDRVREGVASRTGVSPGAVMVAATHTHSGPHVTDAFWCERSEMEAAYFRRLTDALIRIGAEAWEARRPGELVAGMTRAPGLASNRRAQREDGVWINVWSDPEGKQRGYCDETVDLVGVRRSDGRLEALLVNYGCHPVCFGGGFPGISGDYVSYLKDELEYGGHAGTVLFTVSGHANVDPRRGVGTDPTFAREMGARLAQCVAGALPGLKPLVSGKVAGIRDLWEFEADWELGGRVRIYFPHADKGSRVRTAIAVLAAGDLALLGLPGETVSEYRVRLASSSPFPRTLLISVANDFIGYLPTDAILREGAYEAFMCPRRPIEAELLTRAATALTRARAIVSAS
jgi:neutral ceramidase